MYLNMQDEIFVFTFSVRSLKMPHDAITDMQSFGYPRSQRMLDHTEDLTVACGALVLTATCLAFLWSADRINATASH